MQEAVIIEKVGKKDFVAINLQFTNKNLAKNLPELYLYYKLRVLSAPTAGWIKDFVYTKNEKYNILPNLIKLGWISADCKKVNKYRDVVANCGCKSRVTADITAYELCDIETFNLTDRIVLRKFTSFQDQHEFTDAQATSEWLLWVDADERITLELRAEIEGLKSRVDADLPDGFWIPRKTWYLDRWIKHSGWYPDRQMRLYRKAKSYWGGIPPHETARVDGRVEKLNGEILHFTQRDLSGHHSQVDRFTTQTASHLFKTGARVGGVGIFLYPIAAFLRTYIYKQGFRDGVPGLIMAMFTAYYVFLRYAKLWEHKNIKQ